MKWLGLVIFLFTAIGTAADAADSTNCPSQHKMPGIDRCATEQDARNLGQARFLVPWAVEVCGGIESPSMKQVMKVLEEDVVVRGKVLDSWNSTRQSRRDQIERIRMDKRSDEARRFCQSVNDEFGARGALWPGLYKN